MCLCLLRCLLALVSLFITFLSRLLVLVRRFEARLEFYVAGYYHERLQRLEVCPYIERRHHHIGSPQWREREWLFPHAFMGLPPCTLEYSSLQRRDPEQTPEFQGLTSFLDSIHEPPSSEGESDEEGSTSTCGSMPGLVEPILDIDDID